MKSEYTDQQKSIAAEVVSIACGYVEPLSILSEVIAKLDVLTSFAQVSTDAPEPYVRPRLLAKGLTDDCNVTVEIQGQKVSVKILTQNILKTVTDMRLDLQELLYVGPTGFQLAPSDLTLDDPDGSKIKVILFAVRYVKNGNGDYIDCPWASLWMTLKGYRSRSQSFDWKYLENGDRYEDPRAFDWHVIFDLG